MSWLYEGITPLSVELHCLTGMQLIGEGHHLMGRSRSKGTERIPRLISAPFRVSLSLRYYGYCIFPRG